MATCSATILVLVLGLLAAGARSQRRASGARSGGTAVDFDCPEEFGYYPHPSDCTQYYVCVFGGALLESCTGGLMYSHELQTCDWPRNVGCGEAESASVSTVRVTDPRTRQTTPSGLTLSRSPVSVSRSQKEQQLQRQQQDELTKQHQLYADDLGPAEEIETDRQQRVYRGQPSTIGQVQRDRDGLTHQGANVIPAPAGRINSGDKISVISFGTQQQNQQQAPQHTQYRVEPSPPPQIYVQPAAVQVSPTSAPYNKTQQQESSQYDPYYNLYDDEDVYKDTDYGQYTNNQGRTSSSNGNTQYRGQSPYKQAPQQIPVQPQRSSTYSQPSYSSQDIYSQTNNAQDYNENYNAPIGSVDQVQYQDPTRLPGREDRNELKITNEPTTTRIPSTTTIKSSTVSTTTTSVGSTVSTTSSQTRHRGDAATQPIRTSTKQNDISGGFESFENSPSDTNSRHNYRSSNSRSSTPPRQPNIPQIQQPISSSSAAENRAVHKVTLTAALALDDPFSAIPKSRGQNSRRTSNQANEDTSDVITINSAGSRGNSQRTQAASRRVASKSFEVAEPAAPSRSASRNSDIITVDDYTSAPLKIISSNEADARRAPVKSSTPTEVPVSRAAAYRNSNNPNPDTISTPQHQNLRTSDYETPKTARLTADTSDKFHDDQDNEDNSQSLISSRPSFRVAIEAANDYPESDSNPLSRPLSRNSIAQSETTTVRSRSRSTTEQAPCSDDVDSNKNTGCTERTQVRVRPTTAPPESQTTPGPSRSSSSNRNRGSSPYISSGIETVNRGTPASVRTRPTLKPSTSIVSKASEYIDIFRNPPSRPAPLYPTPQPDRTAAKCRKDVCLLPDCYCGGKDIPGDLPVEDVPQIVLLTFDDSANDLNKGLYSDLFEKGRKNPNGCPISATFYVSHEWTDYSHVQNLYASGHEIASHSISHSFGEQFSQKKWSKEIGGQREILAAYGGVRLEDVRGMRAPFLAVGGNNMFKMLYDTNFTYDSSMPVYENRPPSWPYTLDYKIFHDCMIPPCPTKSYPGVWEVPMVMWQDLNGGRCSMGDACSNPPTADGVYKMLIKNFERHYTTNRAPFGLFYHAAWFTQPHHKEGFEAFLDTIVNMDDVWLVTNWQAIQWVRDPTPLSRVKNFPPFQCNYPERPKKCNNPKVCNLWHKSGVRYMRTCQPCPDVYPWTGKTGVRNSRVDNEILEE